MAVIFLSTSEVRVAGAICGVLLVFQGGGFGRPATAGELTVHRDIPYAAPPEGVPTDRLTLDVFTQEGVDARPVVVFFHGGGVDGGDKRAALAKPARFLAEGYVFVSANRRWVRMPGPGDWMSDSVAALRWVKDQIADYGGDASRLFLMGHSAGAALAALLATDQRHLERVGMKPADMRAVSILDTGGIDKLRQKREAPFAPVVRLYAELGLDDRMLAETSAISFIAPDKGIPPMILHCGGARRICAGFAARLREIGVDAEDYDTHGKSHAQINRDLGTPGDLATEEILDFFARHGGAER
jgi:acetyl esterase/lipase